MTTRVLGINNYSHDSSVAVIEDGRVVFAVAEERLSRIRKDRSFPKLSIAAALADRGVTLQDLDAVAFGWNKPPATQIHTLLTSLRGQVPRSASFIGHSLFGIPREMHNGIVPRVNFPPICIFISAFERLRAWASVFTAINSTP